MTQDSALVAPASVHWEIGNAFSSLLKRRRIDSEWSGGGTQGIRRRSRYVSWTWTLKERSDCSGAFDDAYDAYLIACAQQVRASAADVGSRILRESAAARRSDSIWRSLEDLHIFGSTSESGDLLEEAMTKGRSPYPEARRRELCSSPERPGRSPFEVEGSANFGLPRAQIIRAIHESRKEVRRWDAINRLLSVELRPFTYPSKSQPSSCRTPPS